MRKQRYELVCRKPSVAIAMAVFAGLLTACSGGEAPAPADGQNLAAGAQASPVATEQPRFSDDEIAEMRRFSDEALAALAGNNLACEVLNRQDVAAAFGGEWSEGRFSWFESELRRATSALRGICLFGSIGQQGTVTLRLYESSELAWTLNRRDDQDFTQRFTQRDMEAAPEIAERAYRKPMGADSFDLTCADLGSHIACLSASFRHTDEWTRKDRQIMAVIRNRLAAQGHQ